MTFRTCVGIVMVLSTLLVMPVSSTVSSPALNTAQLAHSMEARIVLTRCVGWHCLVLVQVEPRSATLRRWCRGENCFARIVMQGRSGAFLIGHILTVGPNGKGAIIETRNRFLPPLNGVPVRLVRADSQV